MEFSRRPAKLGTSINGRREKHGEDNVSAADIPVVGFMLVADELNELLEEPHAHKLLFNTRSGGKADQPVFRKLKTFAHTDKYEGCAVTFTLGINREPIELKDVKVSKIRLEPMAGGLTAMSFSIACTEGAEKCVGKLLGRLDSEVDVELTLGEVVEEKAAAKQQDLPINNFGDGEAPEASTDEGGGKKRGRGGHRPAAH